MREKAAVYAGFARTLAAPWWRKLIRWCVVVSGFALFCTMQYGMAFLINRWWWWFIVAFFVIAGSLALASFRPILVFVIWLVVSPFGRHFLYMDFGWLAFPALTFDFIAIYFLAGVLLFRVLANRKPVRKLLFAEWMMLSFVAYVAATQMFSGEHSKIMDIVRLTSRVLIPEVLIISVLYFVTKGVIERKEHVATILKAMILFGFLMALVNFYEHFTGNRWYSLVVGFGIPLAWQGIAQGRASGMFDSAAAPSMLISTTLFLTYHFAGWSGRPLIRAMCYIAVVVMAVGAFFTYTRNVYTLLVLFALFMPLISGVGRLRFALLTAAVLITVVAMFPSLVQNREFINRMTDRKNAEDRIIFGRMTWNVFRHHPWFGVGWGQVNKVHKDYVTEMKQLTGQFGQRGLRLTHISHNTYLTILAEQGIIGSLLYFGGILAFLVLILRIRRRMPAKGFLGRDYVSLVFVSSVLFLASIQTIDILNIPYVHWIFWMQFALVVRLDELQRQESELAVRAEEPLGRMAAVPAAAG